jgi:hypothetical protein
MGARIIREGHSYRLADIKRRTPLPLVDLASQGSQQLEQNNLAEYKRWPTPKLSPKRPVEKAQ